MIIWLKIIHSYYRFALFGGNISGKFTEIVPHKKIGQTWRYTQWPSGHFSNVELEFEEKDDHTLLNLKQTLVPSNEYESTMNNWSRYYFDSIRATFGFGSFLYWINKPHINKITIILWFLSALFPFHSFASNSCFQNFRFQHCTPFYFNSWIKLQLKLKICLLCWSLSEVKFL